MISLAHRLGLGYAAFTLQSAESLYSGYRFGGRPPKGINPASKGSDTRFLATLKANDEFDVSMFATLNYASAASPFWFYDKAYAMHERTEALVQFVVHRP